MNCGRHRPHAADQHPRTPSTFLPVGPSRRPAWSRAQPRPRQDGGAHVARSSALRKKVVGACAMSWVAGVGPVEGLCAELGDFGHFERAKQVTELRRPGPLRAELRRVAPSGPDHEVGLGPRAGPPPGGPGRRCDRPRLEGAAAPAPHLGATRPALRQASHRRSWPPSPTSPSCWCTRECW